MTQFAQVKGPIPGPRSRALVEREALLAPGIQSISSLAGIAVDHGKGAVLVDVDGNQFIDFVAGICVSSIGHGHPALRDALAAQAGKLSAGSFATEARAQLLERIAGLTSKIGTGSLRRTQFYSGGAEAVESALRLARAHTKKYEVIAFYGGFHGKTGGVLGLMGSTFKQGLGPTAQMAGQYLAPFPDSYKLGKDPAVAGAEAIESLRRLIELQTTGSLAAILVEPIQGTNGNVIPPAGFLKAVKEVAREHGALLILDEMITGWGRTGKMFGQEHEGVEADIMTFGKGVGNGFPVTGLVTTDAIVNSADPWSRPSFSSSSYGGSPLAMAAANAVTRTILDEKMADNAARVGEVMLGALQKLKTKYSFIGDVRGKGLLLALELVADRQTRTPLDKKSCETIFRGCLERGLLTMAYAPRVRINPPLCITQEQALEGIQILDEAFAEFSRKNDRSQA